MKLTNEQLILIIRDNRDMYIRTYKTIFNADPSFKELTAYDSGILAGLAMTGYNVNEIIKLLVMDIMPKESDIKENADKKPKEPIISPYLGLL